LGTLVWLFFFSSRRRHTRCYRDWSSDVCSSDLQTIFTYVMVAIAAISLLVGGIGIMNIVLATVLERTREIGVRRATGARRVDIVRQFLAESVLISVGGGLLGIGFGFFLAWLIART